MDAGTGAQAMMVTAVEMRREAVHVPSAVLVFCWIDAGVVWVRHRTRGWEVPGGKIEPGESPEVAARREVLEESGVMLESLQWVGEYELTSPDANGDATTRTYKWVYVGTVLDVQARSSDAETVDVRVCRPPWTPSDVHGLGEVSYVMKDEAFRTLWPIIQDVQSAVK